MAHLAEKHNTLAKAVDQGEEFGAQPIDGLFFTGSHATGARIAITGKRYPIAVTQEHSAMYGRALAREVSTIDSHDDKGSFKQQLSNVKKQGNDSHAPPNLYLYKPEIERWLYADWLAAVTEGAASGAIAGLPEMPQGLALAATVSQLILGLSSARLLNRIWAPASSATSCWKPPPIWWIWPRSTGWM